jgi:hypothetical protein
MVTRLAYCEKWKYVITSKKDITFLKVLDLKERERNTKSLCTRNGKTSQYCPSSCLSVGKFQKMKVLNSGTAIGFSEFIQV